MRTTLGKITAICIFFAASLITSCEQKSNTGTKKVSSQSVFIDERSGDTIPTGKSFEVETKIDSFTDSKPASLHLIPKSIFKNKFDSIPTITSAVYHDSALIMRPMHDTIPLVETIPLKMDTCVLKFSPATTVLSPRFKENAGFDLQYLDVDQGMLSSNITTLQMDKKNRMWIGTDRGLSCFDGHSIRHFTKASGLHDNLITRLFVDSKNNVWIGSQYGGVAKFDGHKLYVLNRRNGLIANNVSDIREDKNGNIWISTWGGGVSCIKGNTLNQIGRRNGLTEARVLSIEIDKHNAVFIATNGGGLYRFNGKQLVKYDRAAGLYNGYLLRLLYDSKDRLWMGNWGSMDYLQNDSSTHFKLDGQSGGLTTAYIFEDSRGWIWYATQAQGLAIYTGNDIYYLREENGLPTNACMSVCEDEQGHIWVGTAPGGICRFNPNSFRFLNEKSGLHSRLVNRIQEDKSGRIVIATSSGPMIIDGDTLIDFAINSENAVYKTHIQGLAIDNEGRYLFGTIGAHSWKFDPKRNLAYFSGRRSGDHNIAAIGVRKNGEIWYGSFGVGISRADSTTYRKYNRMNKVNIYYGNDILVDSKDRVWIGTDMTGLVLFENEKFTFFTTLEGLPSNQINQVTEDRNGKIWAATTEGLAYYENNTWKKVPKKMLPHENVCALVQDKNGNYWITSVDGMVNWIKKDKTTGKNWSVDKYIPRFFSKQDGLLGVDFLSASAFIDSKNQLWLGTGRGLLVKDLNAEKYSTASLDVGLSEIRINGQFIDFHNIHSPQQQKLFGTSWNKYIGEVNAFANYPGQLQLPSHLNHLTFHFTGNNWGTSPVKFSYKLEGLDSKWSAPTSSDWAEYRNLSYGRYTLLVKAVGEGGMESKVFRYNIRIFPPWYQTWWARSIFLLIAGLLVYLLIRWRTSALRKRQIELEKTVAERTAEVILQKNEIEEQNKEIKDSIKYAKRIQQAILPAAELIQAHFPNHFILYKPKDIVAGDFYWMESLKNDSGTERIKNTSILFAAADCTGHGVPGAMVSVVCHNALNRCVREEKLELPNKILDRSRELIIEEFEKGGENVKDGMDISMISYNSIKRNLMFSGANNPLWIIRKSEVNPKDVLFSKSSHVNYSDNSETELTDLKMKGSSNGFSQGEHWILYEIKGDKQPIGKHDFMKPFTSHELELLADDRIYIFTDGFQDQFGGDKGKKFKANNLKKLLLHSQHLTLADQGHLLEKYLDQWKGDLEQVDDICVIGIQV